MQQATPPVLGPRQWRGRPLGPARWPKIKPLRRACDLTSHGLRRANTEERVGNGAGSGVEAEGRFEEIGDLKATNKGRPCVPSTRPLKPMVTRHHIMV